MCAARDPTPMEAARSISVAGHLLSWGVVSPKGVNRDLNQKESKHMKALAES